MKDLIPYFLFVLLILQGCTEEGATTAPAASSSDPSTSAQVYELRTETGITFDNEVVETRQLNTLTNDALLNGGGVGILDVNNDGLQDIYFAGNMIEDKLYLNKGNFTFEDISATAGILGNNNWSSGVAIVDINADGYDDIYVCQYLYDDKTRRPNKLFINNKNNTFSERAASYGIADTGYGVMANFFDYDLDGDLDLYIANQPTHDNELKRDKARSMSAAYSDRLYRNDGKKFTDVTVSAGVSSVFYSLSATVGDLNDDGWPDIYVATDFDEPDFLYQNNGDGTFTNIRTKALKHMSNFSMGADIADINNDGYLDIFTADMVAESNFRNKTNMSSMDIDRFWRIVNGGYGHQYMFNALQLNNGNGTYSEIAQMAGVSKTDWSWAPLFLDADQDGHKDLFVTNGILKEIRNKDYVNKIKKVVNKTMMTTGKAEVDPLKLTAMAPAIKIKNKAYRNQGDLTFSNQTDDWGFGKSTWSQGMAYADLDNDGDLDLVISNMNDPASILENKIQSGANKSIIVSAKGPTQNTRGVNSRVTVTLSDGTTQISEITPYRGYMSSSEAVAHFGLGDRTVASVEVVFPGGKTIMIHQPKEKRIVVDYAQAKDTRTDKSAATPLFSAIAGTTVLYPDNVYPDYEREILLPYKMSQLGPYMAVADVNGDGNDDYYIGGAVGKPGQLVLQDDAGGFAISRQQVFEYYRNFEDGAATFFDYDGDGDLDLYICSGGNEYALNGKAYQDRILQNDGSGNFTAIDALPVINISTAVVSPHDFDGDGDLDLFVGGRQYPGRYGHPVSSLLLRNDNGRFTDISDQSPVLKDIGMVTDAAWADVTGDTSPELILCGEWMPIKVLSVQNGVAKEEKSAMIPSSHGLWNTLAIADLDHDGDMDIIAGNYGTNYKYRASADAPLELYVDDFDENGSNDVYLGYHDEEDGKLYPVRGRQCSSEQMPFVKDKFEDYDAFGKATVMDVLDGKLEGSTILKAHTIAHTVFLNQGSGQFSAEALPNLAQVSSIYDITLTDLNGDGHLDALGVGNFHQREVETTRSDAGVGTVLMGDGNGKFTPMHPSQTGLLADKDARALGLLRNQNGETTLTIANNSDAMQFFRLNK